MPGTWVDFKELREKLRFEDVLRHYKVEINRKGNQHLGPCPLPGHGQSGGSDSFSANLDLGIFQCFGCGAKGNLLEFAALAERVNPKDGRAFRAVALKLQKRFFGQLKPAPESKSGSSKEVIVNSILDFELKGLDVSHQFLKDKGLKAETVSHFGLGFCSRGSLKDSLAIPLRNGEGGLVGYASERPRTPGQYVFPETRGRNGKAMELRPSLFLYHGHQIKSPAPAIIVVPDFASAWWLWQGGFRSVVATMSAECSKEQAAIAVSVVGPIGRVWLMSEAGKEGDQFAHSCFEQILPYRFVRWLRLERSVSEFSPEDLQKRFDA